MVRGLDLPRRRTFIAFLRFSMSFLVSWRLSSISLETLTASSCSWTRLARCSSVSSGGGMRTAIKGSLAHRGLERARMARRRRACLQQARREEGGFWLLSIFKAQGIPSSNLSRPPAPLPSVKFRINSFLIFNSPFLTS